MGRPFDPTAHDCKLWGWGSNKFGELLQQPIGGKNVNSPIRITQQQLGPLQVDDIRSIQSGTAACRVGLAVTCTCWSLCSSGQCVVACARCCSSLFVAARCTDVDAI